jgi:hypothetical protein
MGDLLLAVQIDQEQLLGRLREVDPGRFGLTGLQKAGSWLGRRRV